MSTYPEIVLRWILQNILDDKSWLVQVMAWYRQGYVDPVIPSSLYYKTHFGRQLNCCQSDVVGASPVSAAPTTSSFIILEILWYVAICHHWAAMNQLTPGCHRGIMDLVQYWLFSDYTKLPAKPKLTYLPWGSWSFTWRQLYWKYSSHQSLNFVWATIISFIKDIKCLF